jgi:precorrin-2 dehydrogenase/sirohydrochlorin ferrochelatase
MNQNELYPIFLKVTQLNVLIVGGGNVGLEKLTFLLKSSPNAKVTIVATEFHPELIALAQEHSVQIIEDLYMNSYLEGKHLVIATTNYVDVNIQVYNDCKAKSILVNVADNPPYCDFYMGGIVTKGNIKIAISTNGKSPTLAKRLRQFFEVVIPDNIDELAENLNAFRKTIQGDFQEKVTTLNDLTKGIVTEKNNQNKQ